MEHVHQAPGGPALATPLPAETLPPPAPSSRAALSTVPPSLRSLTPAPARARSQPPPKHVRASVIPADPEVRGRATLPAPATTATVKGTPPPPPSRRSDTRRPAAVAASRSHVPWSGRDAARVSIVKSSTEPGLFYVRLLENGKEPFEGVEGLLVSLDPEASLSP